MINYIVGEVDEIYNKIVSIKTHFDVAFLVKVVDPEKFVLNKEYKLYIYTIFNQVNFVYYGFLSPIELRVFMTLLEVNGIGPKTALQILKNIDYTRLIYYVNEKRIYDLEKINGIGNKAEKIVAEMKGELSNIIIEEPCYRNVYDALISLGYKHGIASEVITKLPKDLSEGEALKEAINLIKNG